MIVLYAKYDGTQTEEQNADGRFSEFFPVAKT
jgi:hypothetical protein